MNNESLFDSAMQIARGAGRILLECFQKRVSCRSKGDFDVVTEADFLAEAFILRGLRDAAPDHAVLSEESGANGGEHPCRWYIDPLDGTKNFGHGHACFCTMLALERDGEMELAVVFDPVRDEMFTARLGSGAWCNGEPLAVSRVQNPGEALVASGYPSGKRHRGAGVQPFWDMAMNCQALRRTGCTGLDLAYLAAGRFDAVWDRGLESWDVAPGMLLAREAGAQCTTWNGDAYRVGSPELLAANPALHQELLLLLERGVAPASGQAVQPL